VHAPQGSSPHVEGRVALHDGRVEPLGRELREVERAREVAAVVGQHVELDHEGAGERRFGELHA
jgi:hypothetical protein